MIVTMGTTLNTVEPKRERAEGGGGSSEILHLAVMQPPKMKSLLDMLNILSDLPERISEVSREDASQDLGAAGSAGYAAAKGQGASARDQAMRSLPATDVMRTRLTHHLQSEVRELEHQARKLAQSVRQGSAYVLNELYAKIRRIQMLIVELLDAAEEVIRRLYIRLFIDHQQLV
jgi:hypothetical protein